MSHRREDFKIMSIEEAVADGILGDAITREAAETCRRGRDRLLSITNPYNLASRTELRWFRRAWQHFEGNPRQAEIVKVSEREVEIWRRM